MRQAVSVVGGAVDGVDQPPVNAVAPPLALLLAQQPVFGERLQKHLPDDRLGPPVRLGDQVPETGLALHGHIPPVGHEDFPSRMRGPQGHLKKLVQLVRQQLVLLAYRLAPGSPRPLARGHPRISASVNSQVPPARTPSSRNGLTPSGTNRSVSSKIAWHGASSAVSTYASWRVRRPSRALSMMSPLP